MGIKPDQNWIDDDDDECIVNLYVYFLPSVFLLLTPLMIISGLLSLKLVRHIEQKEKEKKKKGI